MARNVRRKEQSLAQRRVRPQNLPHEFFEWRGRGSAILHNDTFRSTY